MKPTGVYMRVKREATGRWESIDWIDMTRQEVEDTFNGMDEADLRKWTPFWFGMYLGATAKCEKEHDN